MAFVGRSRPLLLAALVAYCSAGARARLNTFPLPTASLTWACRRRSIQSNVIQSPAAEEIADGSNNANIGSVPLVASSANLNKVATTTNDYNCSAATAIVRRRQGRDERTHRPAGLCLATGSSQWVPSGLRSRLHALSKNGCPPPPPMVERVSCPRLRFGRADGRATCTFGKRTPGGGSRGAPLLSSYIRDLLSSP